MEKFSGTTVDARLVWKTVREITAKSAMTRQFNFQPKGLSGADVANLFNDHFAAVGCSQHHVVQIPCENFITSNSLNTIYLYPTDEHEIISEILSLKDGCSSGADEIKPRPLKAVSSIVNIPLAHLTNLIT